MHDMVSTPDVCLITPGHLTSTPRLVKVANSLASAGYSVHVVAGRYFAPAEQLDLTILAAAEWSCTHVAYHRGIGGILSRLRRQFARRGMLHSSRPSTLTATRALHAGVPALVTAAIRVPAAFYFGFGGVPGLAAAATAAAQRSVAYGFDAEDWHEGESDLVQQNQALARAVPHVLGELLPRASFVSAASPPIAEAYARTYSVKPVCLLNVFPLAEAPGAPATRPLPTEQQPAALYWFSQTIGPGRGLEQMIDVLARMRTPTRLELRGFVADAYRTELTSRVRAAEARVPLFLPPAPASEMVRLASHAHLGLSVEQSAPPNRDLCLSNKIFTYLLAGVPVALTPTAAQRALAPDLGSAALIVDLTEPSTAAANLDRWFSGQPAAAAAEAWRLGHERYNWDHEQHVLLDALRPYLRKR